MVQGLSDNDIRDLVRQTLEDAVKYVEGRESGKSSNRLMLGIRPTMNKITPFQRAKFTREPETGSGTEEKCSPWSQQKGGRLREDVQSICRKM